MLGKWDPSVAEPDAVTGKISASRGWRAGARQLSASSWYQTSVRSGPFARSAGDRSEGRYRHGHPEWAAWLVWSWAPCARASAADLNVHPSGRPGAHACNRVHFTSKLQAGLAASERPRSQAGILGRLRACADNLRDLGAWSEREHVHLFSSEHHAGLSGEEEAPGVLGIWAGLSDGPCCYSRDPQVHGSGVLRVFSLVNFSPEQLERTNRICIPTLM